METPAKVEPVAPRRRMRHRFWRGCAVGCAGVLAMCIAVAAVFYVMLGRVPKSYPLATHPIPPPTNAATLGGGLDGFASPYLGHTGSWNGKGGTITGGSKIPDLDKERAMGLRWTFMPVYWRAMEPTGPVDLAQGTPPAWRSLDAFAVAAKERGLNILMQAPVVGGNSGGPPVWAGRREKGRSAPSNMTALVEFTGKLAGRYRPGGTLAQREGWGTHYGVRAWELGNEPEGYLTSWKGEAADYAEFVTKAAARIKSVDPQAVIVVPGLAAGKSSLRWMEQTLDAAAMAGSPAFRAQGKPYSIGPVADVVSFHDYEGLDTFFSGGDRTIGQVFGDVRAVFEKWEQRSPGFTYRRKQEYWHTEGNFDFFGVLSRERRAAWRFQFFTRAFACGIRKVCVMDASPPEQVAVRTYVQTLPNPFPMLPAFNELSKVEGKVLAFRHPDAPDPNSGQVWIVWALAGTGAAKVEIPVHRERVRIVTVDGDSEWISATAGRVALTLKGDAKMAPPVMVVDRPALPAH